eukprot:scaffold60763_cov33-Tisochrysis_lutea.AAC.5
MCEVESGDGLIPCRQLRLHSGAHGILKIPTILARKEGWLRDDDNLLVYVEEDERLRGRRISFRVCVAMAG